MLSGISEPSQAPNNEIGDNIMSKIKCNVCPNYCNLSEGQVGICKARKNENGEIVSINYGHITSLALDPIEKKPLSRFHSGTNILSVGSFGCNLHCPFCQNHSISMSNKNETQTEYKEPDQLIELALRLKDRNNIGLAFTYNEPLIGYEYVRDCGKLAKEHGLMNVVVTNGSFNENILDEIIPYIDAFNIDLKGFTDSFYKKLGGNLETVKKFIQKATEQAHVEVTTLIIPKENDSEEEMIELSQFLAEINPDIPLHVSRFFPTYKMQDRLPTEVRKVYRLANIARERLKYVYEGNC